MNPSVSPSHRVNVLVSWRCCRSILCTTIYVTLLDLTWLDLMPRRRWRSLRAMAAQVEDSAPPYVPISDKFHSFVDLYPHVSAILLYVVNPLFLRSASWSLSTSISMISVYSSMFGYLLFSIYEPHARNKSVSVSAHAVLCPVWHLNLAWCRHCVVDPAWLCHKFFSGQTFRRHLAIYWELI